MNQACTTLIQSITVRVTNKGRSVGTGFIYRNSDHDYACVITAKHCIYGDHSEWEIRNNDIIIDRAINDQFIQGAEPYSLGKDDIILASENKDVAIIILKSKNLPEWLATSTEYHSIDHNYGLKTCYFRGYPSFLGNQEPRTIEASFTEAMVGERNELLIKSKDILDTAIADAGDNTEGLSGSGLFLLAGEKLYLLGLITEFAPIDSFKGLSSKAINQLLIENAFEPIPSRELESNPSVLESEELFRKNANAICAKIKEDIRSVHIIREGIDEVVAEVLSNPVTIVKGDPGVGKSAFIKSVIKTLREDFNATIYLFTAEQFSWTTIDQVLRNLEIRASIESILGSPISNKCKIFWIESLEKLVENGEVDALRELIEIVKADTSVHIITSIRLYAVQQFNLLLMNDMPSKYGLYLLKEFTDSELNVIQNQIPEVKFLFNNQKIKHLLHNPFYLKHAVSIVSVLSKDENLDERRFKSLMWEHVVDDPEKIRGKVFEEIALRRAVEMKLYVSVQYSSEIASLYRDGIIDREDDELQENYSPAHDIFEDWALIRFIARKKNSSSGSIDFFNSIGNQVAIRRAVRLWLGELLESQDEEIFNFIQESFSSIALSQHWKDEVIISVLKSNHSNVFFQYREEDLLSDQAKLMIRFIHLLRTACKEAHPKYKGITIPVGSGWLETIKFLNKHKEKLNHSQYLILNLLIDWKNKLNCIPHDLPEESTDALTLLLFIIDKLNSEYRDYNSRDGISSMLELGIELVFDLTGADPRKVESFLQQCSDSKNNDELTNGYKQSFAEKTIEIVIQGDVTQMLCKYLPDVVINIFKDEIYRIDEDDEIGVPIQYRSSHKNGTGHYFGLSDEVKRVFLPASALQTPLRWLLLFHTWKAVDLILETVDSCGLKYLASSFADKDKIDATSLILNDGSVKQIAGDSLLWSMHRGTSGKSVPYVLQSLLMAFEKYLMELADLKEDWSASEIKQIFNHVFKKTETNALISVLCSVSLYAPEIVADSYLPLLTCKHIFNWEASRDFFERNNLDFGYGISNKVKHTIDRQRAKSQEHRTKYYKGLLHFVVYRLIEDPKFNEAIFAILDRHYEQVDSDNILWLKTLAELDIRTWDLKYDGEKDHTVMSPKYEGKVKKFMDDGLKSLENNRSEFYYSWIYTALNAKASVSLESWKTAFNRFSLNADLDTIKYSVGFAIIGIRDFREHLSGLEYDWCRNTIFESTKDILKLYIRNDYSDHAFLFSDKCLYYFPELVKQEYLKGNFEGINLLLEYLISPIGRDDVKHIQTGIRDHFVDKEELLQICFDLIVSFSLLPPRNMYDLSPTEATRREEENKSLIQMALNRTLIPDVEKIEFNSFNIWFLERAFAIVTPAVTGDSFIQFEIKLLKLHIEGLVSDAKRRNTNHTFSIHDLIHKLAQTILAQEKERSIEIIREVFQITHEALLNNKAKRGYQEKEIEKVTDELLEMMIYHVDTPPDEIITAKTVENFWLSWKEWDKLNKIYGTNHGAASMLFDSYFLLTAPWMKNMHDWKPLKGKSSVILKLIDDYGRHEFTSTLRLISGIGMRELMPNVLSNIASLVRTFPNLRPQLNSVYGAKMISQGFYNFGKTIKQRCSVLDDFIFILDLMVDQGSSEAYLIRENMITFKV